MAGIKEHFDKNRKRKENHLDVLFLFGKESFIFFPIILF